MASRLRSETAERSSQRRCQQGKSKSIRSIDGHPLLEEREWSSEHAAGDLCRERARRPGGPGAARELPPEPRRSRALARDAEPPVAHEVEQHHRPRVRVAAARPPCCRAGPRCSNCASGVPRGLSSPSKSAKTTVRLSVRGLDRAGELDGHRRARGAVVGAHEARDVLRVVVGAHHDVARGRGRAPARPRCAARRAPPGSGRPGSRRRSRARQPPGAWREPAGRGPSSTCSRRSRQAAAESKRSAGCGSPALAALGPSSSKGPVRWPAARRSDAPTSSAGPKPRSTGFTRQLWRAARRPGRLRAVEQAGSQGPADRDRRLVPAPGEAVVAHARGRARDLRGPAARARGLLAPLESRLALVPRYRQKLAFPPFEMGRPFWVDDPSFNLDYHVRHTALPRPGSDEQLRELAGPHLLPAARPLEAALGAVDRPGPRGATASR